MREVGLIRQRVHIAQLTHRVQLTQTIGDILRSPAALLLFLLLICQELNPTGGFGGVGASQLLFLGHQLFYTTVLRLSVVTVAVLAGVIWARAQGYRRRLSEFRTLLMLVAAFGIWCAVVAWYGGASVLTAVNQDGRFAILFVAMLIVGNSVGTSSSRERPVEDALVWGMAGMAILGLYLAATGKSVATSNGTSIVFYDAALPATAGAALLALVFDPAKKRGRLEWILGLSAIVVLLLAGRRNVWAAVIVAFALAIPVVRRAAVFWAVAVAATVTVVALALIAPSALASLGSEIGTIWQASQGSAADVSTAGHISDIKIGWYAATAHPFWGVGYQGHVTGLVVQGKGALYTHNQVLESWLRFGIIGAILVNAWQIVGMGYGMMVLRGQTSFIMRWSAFLLIMAPISALTAPFLTTTQRWPALLGLAGGLLLRSRPGSEPRRT